MSRFAAIILTITLSYAASVHAAVPEAVTDLLSNNRFERLSDPRISDLPLSPGDASASAAAVWDAYRNEQNQNPSLSDDDGVQEVRYGDRAMRYHVSTMGQPDPTGYPLYIALHGGGSAPPYVNDGQWEHMKIYYRDSVKNGVYVAPRAISDTWDMHFQPESYRLYERLIQHMIVMHQVDPDRVYVLGFSAGGDGVYQIAPRISDRLAAANMSAGHPNGVSLINLAHVPLLLQVGEHDGAYNRNRITAEYDGKLEALRGLHPHHYRHATYIHAGKGHNFYDNDPRQTAQVIIADPQAWLDHQQRDTTPSNTNAVAWLNQFTREALPRELRWDLTTVMPPDIGGAPQQHHWLDIGTHTAETLGTREILARIDRASNTIYIEGAKTYLKIWLNSTMLRLDAPIRVAVASRCQQVVVKPNLKYQVQSVLTRKDPRTVFDAAVELHETPEGWETTAP